MSTKPGSRTLIANLLHAGRRNIVESLCLKITASPASVKLYPPGVEVKVESLGS
jgi:hypothetical protein